MICLHVGGYKFRNLEFTIDNYQEIDNFERIYVKYGK